MGLSSASNTREGRSRLGRFQPAPLRQPGKLLDQRTSAVSKPPLLAAHITREERSNLVLSFARVLYINGESTQKTLSTAERLGNCLGFRATILPRWGELELLAEDTDGKFISVIEANPSGVDMERVVSALKTVGELCESRLPPANAM